MICNADRRAIQGRWDDAVARLYRATELWAQDRAYHSLCAVLGKVPLAKLPPDAQQALSNQGGEPTETGFVPLGLKRLIEVVDAYGRCNDEPKAVPIYESVEGHLQKRNSSILAHGNRPATEDDYRLFRSALCTGLGFTEDDLPHWPKLSFGVS